MLIPGLVENQEIYTALPDRTVRRLVMDWVIPPLIGALIPPALHLPLHLIVSLTAFSPDARYVLLIIVEG